MKELGTVGLAVPEPRWVAARALGVGRATAEDALRYAQERESAGEGTSEIQRDVIARRLAARHRIR